MEQPQPVLVETVDLTKVYGDGEQVYALNKVNLRITAGELVAVMGPSGSGKSTLLNLLGALDTPTSGKVLVRGEDLAALRDKDRFRAKTVGFVFQLHNLIPTLTARENVEVPMMGYYSAAQRRARALELLAMVGLADRANHLPAQLSGGQRQRVAIARALANDPLIVLADEPTGNLDSQASLDLMRLIAELNRLKGTTFVVVTHDFAVARQTRRVLTMADGRIVREDLIGSPLEEDLKMWRYSGLGQRIYEGKLEELQMLGIKPKQQRAIRKLLELAEQP
ncbi:MAG: ABC transporter ATP-binding protein [Anaerolineales bacterium]|nr:ABC transporter ATP-binding protein [Anaerolineales bacterium]MCS7247818.1 ABC transporter ATP-binding protein [Anaerolineales bacterium]MDW8161628.1 ABC transporter ATP-binding protein [Anaerolineales bacterium]MDW8446084.1 ABC transporter ATP-binding protein [Anaerolineales bacterium]